MCYVAKPNNGYFVRVGFVKKTGCWETEKFKGKRPILSASGPTFMEVMRATTMLPLGARRIFESDLACSISQENSE